MAAGEKYAGLMLENGRIGVCSVLNNRVSARDLGIRQPDLRIMSHRIVYNAYLNALLNYDIEYEDEKDIFDHKAFAGRHNITMVGFFRPLVRKFTESGIRLTIFDLVEKDEALTPLHKLESELGRSETVILTSTTLFNGSFLKILERTPEGCEVLLLGPSSILHPDLMGYRNVRKIYGAVFDLFDGRILDIIAGGHGAQTFLKHAKKVNI